MARSRKKGGKSGAKDTRRLAKSKNTGRKIANNSVASRTRRQTRGADSLDVNDESLSLEQLISEAEFPNYKLDINHCIAYKWWHCKFLPEDAFKPKRAPKTDCHVKFGEKLIPACKETLIKVSEYFRFLLKGSVVEVEFARCDLATLRAVVKFMHTGKIELRSDNVLMIAELAEYLALRVLHHACVNIIVCTLSVDKVMTLIMYAKRVSLTFLMKGCKDFAGAAFSQLASLPSTMSCSAEQIEDLVASPAKLNGGQSEIVDFICRWVSVDVSDRLPSLERLLSYVYLPNLPEDHRLSDDLPPAVLRAFQAIPRPSHPNPKMPGRHFHAHLLISFAPETFGTGLPEMYRYIASSETIEKLPTFTTSKTSCQKAIATCNSLYVFECNCTRRRQKDLPHFRAHCYSFFKKSWGPTVNVKPYRCFCCLSRAELCVLKEHMLIFGAKRKPCVSNFCSNKEDCKLSSSLVLSQSHGLIGEIRPQNGNLSFSFVQSVVPIGDSIFILGKLDRGNCKLDRWPNGRAKYQIVEYRVILNDWVEIGVLKDDNIRSVHMVGYCQKLLIIGNPIVIYDPLTKEFKAKKLSNIVDPDQARFVTCFDRTNEKIPLVYGRYLYMVFRDYEDREYYMAVFNLYALISSVLFKRNPWVLRKINKLAICHRPGAHMKLSFFITSWKRL